MNKDILMVGNCESCNESSTFIFRPEIKTDGTDIFNSMCLNCNVIRNHSTIPSDFINAFKIDRESSIHEMLVSTSEEYSKTYIKSDFYYLLNVFFTYFDQPIQTYINPKGAFSWQFNMRLPSLYTGNQYISIKNVNDDAIYIMTNVKIQDETHIKKVIDNLFTYIIAFCDDKTNGYFTTSLMVRSLEDDNKKRIENLKVHFSMFNNSKYYNTKSAKAITNSMYGKFQSNLSSQITSAVNNTQPIMPLLQNHYAQWKTTGGP